MEPVRDVDHPPGRPTGVPGNGSAIYRQSAARLPIGPRLPCSACPRRTRGRSGTWILLQALQPEFQETAPPFTDSRLRDSQSGRDFLVRHALGALEDDPGPERQGLCRGSTASPPLQLLSFVRRQFQQRFWSTRSCHTSLYHLCSASTAQDTSGRSKPMDALTLLTTPT